MDELWNGTYRVPEDFFGGFDGKGKDTEGEESLTMIKGELSSTFVSLVRQKVNEVRTVGQRS